MASGSAVNCGQIPAGSVLSAQGLLCGAALAFFGRRHENEVYVDGFNLYYGALKGTPFRWLDPVRLSALLLPSACVVEKVRYFTARVSGSSDRNVPARQQVYLNALRTLSEVEVYFGSFLAKTVWRPLVNLPVANRRIDTPKPVVLPAGDHTVAGPSTQTLLPLVLSGHPS